MTLVLFSSPGCAPCKILHPIIEKVALKYPENIGFLYVEFEDYNPGVFKFVNTLKISPLLVLKGNEPHGFSFIITVFLLLTLTGNVIPDILNSEEYLNMKSDKLPKSAKDNLTELLDAGSQAAFNMSFNDLSSASDKAGKKLSSEEIAVLALLGGRLLSKEKAAS